MAVRAGCTKEARVHADMAPVTPKCVARWLTIAFSLIVVLSQLSSVRAAAMPHARPSRLEKVAENRRATVYAVRGLVVTPLDTEHARSLRRARDARSEQPHDTHLGVRFRANGTNFEFELELDSSLFADNFTFNFRHRSEGAAWSEAPGSGAWSETRVRPTRNHYAAFPASGRWVSATVHSGARVQAVFNTDEHVLSLDHVDQYSASSEHGRLARSLRERDTSVTHALVVLDARSPADVTQGSGEPTSVPWAPPPSCATGSSEEVSWDASTSSGRDGASAGGGDSTNLARTRRGELVLPVHWSGCYTGQSKAKQKQIDLGVAVDVAYTQEFTSRKQVADSISAALQTSSVVMRAQFDVALGLADSIIMMDEGGPAWNRRKGATARSCGWSDDDDNGDIGVAMNAFSKWKTDARDAARAAGNLDEAARYELPLWHMLSNCFNLVSSPVLDTEGKKVGNTCSGVAGLANVGQLCNYATNVGVSNLGSGCEQKVHPELTWRTVVHEIGHSLGASHLFGGDGVPCFGIMDYCDGFYRGITQFHPKNEPQICSVLDKAVTLTPDTCLRPIRSNPHRLTYHWRSVVGPCDVTCGRGKRSVTQECVSTLTNTPANVLNCLAELKPVSILEDCEASVPCEEMFAWRPYVVDEPCETKCGFGKKVSHRWRCWNNTANAAVQEVEGAWEAACDSVAPKPLETTCFAADRPCFAWKAELWGFCDKACGVGRQRRLLTCEYAMGTIVDRHHCEAEHHVLDVESRDCLVEHCSQPTLEEVCSTTNAAQTPPRESFGPCSGMVKRGGCGFLECAVEPECRVSYQYIGTPVPDGTPCESTACRGERCGLCANQVCVPQGYRWTVGHWSDTCASECTKPDPTAEQTREVSCVDGTGTKVERQLCEPTDEPLATRDCPYCLPAWNQLQDGKRHSFFVEEDDLMRQFYAEHGAGVDASSLPGSGDGSDAGLSTGAITAVAVLTVVAVVCGVAAVVVVLRQRRARTNGGADASPIGSGATSATTMTHLGSSSSTTSVQMNPSHTNQ